MYHHSIPALGTIWTFESSKIMSTEFLHEINHVIINFENNYSRFKEDSLLSKLNNNKILHNTPDELIEMLYFAIEMYKESDGYFNISIGSQLENDGYGLKSKGNTSVSRNLISDISIDANTITISPNTRLDFGGFGKGWLVDKVHQIFVNNGYKDHIINAGGDIRVGSKSHNLYIENPFDSSEFIDKIMCHNNSLAVSSPLKRTWKYKGKIKNHIINPLANTNSPIIQVSVKHRSCLVADVMATLLHIVPINIGKDLIKSYNLEYQIVYKNHDVITSSGFKS